MTLPAIIFAVLLAVISWFSLNKRKLTPGGVAVAIAISIVIFLAAGLPGIFFLGTFFILGIGATAYNRKKHFNSEPEQRDALQVIANAGVPALLSVLAMIIPDYKAILLLMTASAFASAIADTVSSELGVVYGNKCYNILTLQKDIKGENGVISMEGTLLGLAASMVMAMVYSLTVDDDPISFLAIIIAGTLGNLSDSFLGATLERRNIIGNNAVNFLNTLIAAAIGGMLVY